MHNSLTQFVSISICNRISSAMHFQAENAIIEFATPIDLYIRVFLTALDVVLS